MCGIQDRHYLTIKDQVWRLEVRKSRVGGHTSSEERSFLLTKSSQRYRGTELCDSYVGFLKPIYLLLVY